jgi:hypothetical protein
MIRVEKYVYQLQFCFYFKGFKKFNIIFRVKSRHIPPRQQNARVMPRQNSITVCVAGGADGSSACNIQLSAAQVADSSQSAAAAAHTLLHIQQIAG